MGAGGGGTEGGGAGAEVGGGGFYRPHAQQEDLTTCFPGQVWDVKHHR
jgi:hypothetical protein